MGFALGRDCKLYFCAEGIGGTPTWTELRNVKNLKTGLQKGEVDVSTRGYGGWKALATGLKEGSIEFEMVWDPDDPGFAAVEDAYFNDAPIGIAVMSGDIETAGSKGLWADCAVFDFSRDEPLEEGVTVSVTLKPTYSANQPVWKTVGQEATTTVRFTVALVDGAAQVDLTNLPGGINGTGRRLVKLTVTNNGQHAMTLSSPGDQQNLHGYEWVPQTAAQFSIVPSGRLVVDSPSAALIDATHKYLDLAGTGTETSAWEVVLG